jgi:hypothetical protein
MTAGTDRFVAEYPTRHQHPNGQFPFFHFADLYTTGMRTEYPIRILLDIERILHVAGRMMGGQIEGSEIVPVIFDLWSFGNGKPKLLKDGNDLVLHAGHRMPGTDGLGGAG